jgi:hypothetical protein
MIDRKKLKKELMELPISLSNKVELWLLLSGFKKATEILVVPSLWKNNNETKYSSPEDIKKTEAFLIKTGLFYKPIERIDEGKEKQPDNCYRKTTLERTEFLLSLTPDDLDKFAQARKFLDHQALGNFYGFPTETVIHFALGHGIQILKGEGVNINAEPLTSPVKFREMFINEYWYPYVQYLTRTGHELEDSQVAIKWADCIREDLPELAKEFEKEGREAEIR